jgi:hypothetical protein
MTDKVAFGSDKEDGEKCPALTAGFVSAAADAVVKEFDYLAQEKTHEETGTLSTESAARLWNRAIQEIEGVVRKREHDDVVGPLTEEMENELETAKEIQQRLDWD